MENQVLECLKDLESRQNNGRGVSCVKSFIIWFEKGDYESAKACFNNEYDKIRNYLRLEVMMKALLASVGYPIHDGIINFIAVVKINSENLSGHWGPFSNANNLFAFMDRMKMPRESYDIYLLNKPG